MPAAEAAERSWLHRQPPLLSPPLPSPPLQRSSRDISSTTEAPTQLIAAADHPHALPGLHPQAQGEADQGQRALRQGVLISGQGQGCRGRRARHCDRGGGGLRGGHQLGRGLGQVGGGVALRPQLLQGRRRAGAGGWRRRHVRERRLALLRSPLHQREHELVKHRLLLVLLLRVAAIRAATHGTRAHASPMDAGPLQRAQPCSGLVHLKGHACEVCHVCNMEHLGCT